MSAGGPLSCTAHTRDARRRRGAVDRTAPSGPRAPTRPRRRRRPAPRFGWPRPPAPAGSGKRTDSWKARAVVFASAVVSHSPKMLAKPARRRRGRWRRRAPRTRYSPSRSSSTSRSRGPGQGPSRATRASAKRSSVAVPVWTYSTRRVAGTAAAAPGPRRQRPARRRGREQGSSGDGSLLPSPGGNSPCSVRVRSSLLLARPVVALAWRSPRRLRRGGRPPAPRKRDGGVAELHRLPGRGSRCSGTAATRWTPRWPPPSRSP